MSSEKLWNMFCRRMKMADISVPLFDVDEKLNVRIHEIGITRRRFLLKRNHQMEKMIIEETNKLVLDWESETNNYDGLIYLMHCIDNERNVIPLYIGKTETFGKSERNLSANVQNLTTNRNKFARWGDNYQYHVGDLSAVVLAHPGRENSAAKYNDWANALFVKYPINPPEEPRLIKQVYFWTMAWPKTGVGPWEEFGPTNLTFLEYLLIGVASSAYPGTVLNKEGQNRGNV